MWELYSTIQILSFKDDIPSFERAEMTNFDEYEDFVDHIRMTYRQHTLDSSMTISLSMKKNRKHTSN